MTKLKAYKVTLTVQWDYEVEVQAVSRIAAAVEAGQHLQEDVLAHEEVFTGYGWTPIIAKTKVQETS